MKKMKFANILWGLLFLAAAGVIVLHMLGQLGSINTWTLLVSIPIVIGIIHSLVKLEWAGLFFLTAVLAFIHRGWIESSFDIRLGFWALFGIATLLTIGFYILFGKVTRVDKFAWSIGDSTSYEHQTESADGEKVYFEGSFTGSSKYIHSRNLSYVSVKNSFGGMEVYFEDATLSPNGAIVEVQNSFGGVELYIPKDWNIQNEMGNFLAGIDVPERPFRSGAPTITLRGSNSFGGIDVELV